MIRLRIAVPLMLALLPSIAGEVHASGDDRSAIRRSFLELSGPEYAGGEPGRPEGEALLQRIADRFAAAGLVPLPSNGSPFVAVDLYHRVRAQGTNGLRDGRRSYPPLSAWHPLGFSAEGRVDAAPLFFAGYGLHLPGAGRDDFAGIDPVGGVVLVLDEAPVAGTWRREAMRRRKATWAREHGAIGILFAPPRRPGGDEAGPLEPIPLEKGYRDCGILAAELLPSTADALLDGSPFSIETETPGERGATGPGRVGDARVDWIVSLRRQILSARNAVAAQSGDAREWILVQAPAQRRRWSAGPATPLLAADLSVLLALADRIGRGAPQGGAGIVFAAVVGTEQEQAGAEEVAMRLSLTGKPVAAVLTIEGIAAGDGDLVGAAGPSRQWWEDRLRAAGGRVVLDEPPELAGDSRPLADAGVPYLTLRGAGISGGSGMGEGASPGDEERLVKTVDLLESLVRELAEAGR
ncbi:MAG: hypothetical protein GF346_07165 [Candidatus Eisenbacteria bacterium]|nr:hypothetical protein [Candidatus Latescibacterota bacterium]MBD3302210.1 hypothetical protein [Candidatus Eisenbacteria bacterium]